MVKRLSEKDIDRLYSVFDQVLSDVEIVDADIFPTGYREYDIGFFELSVNSQVLVDAVIDALER